MSGEDFQWKKKNDVIRFALSSSFFFPSFLTSEIQNTFGVYSDVHILVNVSLNFQTCTALRLKYRTLLAPQECNVCLKRSLWLLRGDALAGLGRGARVKARRPLRSNVGIQARITVDPVETEEPGTCVTFFVGRASESC